jgi:hypothetical protein
MTNEPPALTAFSTMLLACSSLTTFGVTTAAQHWYPSAANEADDATTPVTKPYLVLSEITHTRTKFAEAGATSAFGGTLRATVFADPATKTVGALEILGRAVCGDLLALSSGLPIRSATCELAGEPDAGIRAADESDTASSIVSIDITVEYGLEA